MSGPEYLWDKLKDTADTFSSKIVLHGLPVIDETSGGHEDITMEVRGTLTCAAASRKSTEENAKYDYFLLSMCCASSAAALSCDSSDFGVHAPFGQRDCHVCCHTAGSGGFVNGVHGISQ